MTNFALKIESDIINFLSIPTDDSGVPVNEHDLPFFEVLSSDPTILDISSFTYNPYPDSEWNGTEFVDTENRELLPMPVINENDRKFAFLVNNKYKLFYGIVEVPATEMIIAALSSDPKVIIR